MVSWILVFHILGIVMWIGGLLGTLIVLAKHVRESRPEARASLADLERKFLRGMADPGALLTILAGIALFTTNSAYYAHARWLHIKFLFVAGLILLHGIVAVASKRNRTGATAISSAQATILLALVFLAFLLILIATLPGAVFLH